MVRIQDKNMRKKAPELAQQFREFPVLPKPPEFGLGNQVNILIAAG